MRPAIYLCIPVLILGFINLFIIKNDLLEWVIIVVQYILLSIQLVDLFKMLKGH